MILRNLQPELLLQLKEYPIVTLLGPRQAGKTTLVKAALPDFSYVSLENPEIRQLAVEDPKGFLRQYPTKTIFDEIQRAPLLLSYLQEMVDSSQANGQFVITGSHQLQIREAISQSLAGRTGVLHLMPLSIDELTRAGIRFQRAEDYLFNGFLPRIYDQKQRAHTAYANYYQTYVERDVRQLIQLKDSLLFEKFIKLLAGRVGQVINYHSLASDIGVSPNTVKDWLALLEASYIVFRLPPYFENFGKRIIKSPKLYFTDTGLLCYLLGIETPSQVSRDPLVGQIFENLVVLEALKSRYNKGLRPQLFFFRDHQGFEIDLVHKSGTGLTGIEIKAASTWNSGFKKSLLRFSEKLHPLIQKIVIYSGEPFDFSDGVLARGFHSIGELI